MSKKELYFIIVGIYVYRALYCGHSAIEMLLRLFQQADLIYLSFSPQHTS